MHAATKVERRTLADQVQEGIVSFIRANGLEAGAALPSAARLAEEFGVSLAVVREALSSLEARGLITVRNGKGATVLPVTSGLLRDYFDRAVRQHREAIVDLLEVRRGIEVQGALLAAARRTPDNLARLDEILAGMREAMGDPERYAEFDTQLHLEIVAASRNAMLFHLCESIRELMKDTIREGLKIQPPGRDIRHTQDVHERIVETIRQGDSDRAGQEMAEHLDGASRKMTSYS